MSTKLKTDRKERAAKFAYYALQLGPEDQADLRRMMECLQAKREGRATADDLRFIRRMRAQMRAWRRQRRQSKTAAVKVTHGGQGSNR